MSEVIKNRYEFTILFDVENGNPNGDPDAANMPRMDPETGLGLVTDVCLKRKIRNYVEDTMEDAPGYKIYIKDGVPLNRSDNMAYTAVLGEGKKLEKKDPEIDNKLRDFMCSEFYDIRTFGAVMTTFVKDKLNCGQVRGPVQIGFARSIDPIVRQEVSITRVAITTEADFLKKETEMGRKHIGGLRFGQSGAQDDRLLGGRPEASVAGYSEYVRKRSQRGAGQNGGAAAHHLQARRGAWQRPVP